MPTLHCPCCSSVVPTHLQRCTCSVTFFLIQEPKGVTVKTAQSLLRWPADSFGGSRESYEPHVARYGVLLWKLVVGRVRGLILCLRTRPAHTGCARWRVVSDQCGACGAKEANVGCLAAALHRECRLTLEMKPFPDGFPPAEAISVPLQHALHAAVPRGPPTAVATCAMVRVSLCASPRTCHQLLTAILV